MDSQLGKDVGQMRLDGEGRNAERVGNLAVRPSRCGKLGHFEFPCGQKVVLRLYGGGLLGKDARTGSPPKSGLRCDELKLGTAPPVPLSRPNPVPNRHYPMSTVFPSNAKP